MTDSKQLSRWALPTLLLIVLAVNFLSLPAQECPGDAVTVRTESVTLLNTGSIRIPESIVGEFAGDRGQYFYQNPTNGQWYSKYGIGNSLVYAPALFLEKLLRGQLAFFSPVRLRVLAALNILFALGIATYLFRIAGFFTASGTIRLLFVVSSFYCTFWWNHLRIQAFEAFQPFFLIGAAYHFLNAGRACREKGTPGSCSFNFTVAGFFLGFLCLLKTFFVILLPVFIVAPIVEATSRRFGERGGPNAGPRHFPQATRRRFQYVRYAVCLLAPILLALLVLLAVNRLKFGSCFETGYTQWKKEANPMSGSILAGLWGYCSHPQFSVFLAFPVFTLGLFGLPGFIRRFPRETAFLYSLGLVVIVGCAKFINWSGGWSYGPRYLLVVLPLLSLPFLGVLEWIGENFRKPIAKAVGGLVLVALLYSLRLQVELNSLPFYAVQCIQAQLVEPLKDPEVARYFNRTPYPLICEDLLAVKAQGEVWWWSRMIQAAPAERRPALLAYFAKQSASNYLFFPDR